MSLQKYGFGVLAVVASLVLTLIITGCKKNTTIYSPINDTLVSGGGGANGDSTVKRILSLGDSYTIGQSVPAADRFPNLTIDWLRAKNIKMQYPAQIVAQTGWTTADLLNGINVAVPKPMGPYDAVTLLIGVNNQYQRRDTAEYRSQFLQCLNAAIGFSGNRSNRVFVLSIPDWGATPYGQNSNPAQVAVEINRFNAINKEICTAAGITYIDITPATRNVGSNPSLVASDGLHYSGKEHSIWADMLGEKMLAVLK